MSMISINKVNKGHKTMKHYEAMMRLNIKN